MQTIDIEKNELKDRFVKVKHSTLAEAHAKACIMNKWLQQQASEAREKVTVMESILSSRESEISPELKAELDDLNQKISSICFYAIHNDWYDIKGCIE